MSAIAAAPNFGKLRPSDWRALLRFSGEAQELKEGSVERRVHVCNSLSNLIGACGTNLFEIDFAPHPARFTAVSDNELCGSIAASKRHVDLYFTQGLAATDPAALPFVKSRRCVGQSCDFASRYNWEASEQFQRIRKPAGIDHQVLAHLFVGKRKFGFGLHRAMGEKPFSTRELQCVEAMILLSPQAFGLSSAILSGQAVGRAISPVPDSAALPPRLKPVFHALLSGDGSKQIAIKLGLSRHTVLEYTKQLYRRLNINSRNELMAMFVHSPGLRN